MPPTWLTPLVGSDWPTRLVWLLIGVAAAGLAGRLRKLARYVVARVRYYLKSDADKAVDRIVWETYQSHIWRKPPVVYPQSVAYIRRNWAAFDPAYVHPRADELPDQMQMPPLLDLVMRNGAYLGCHIGICAHLATQSQLGATRDGLQTRVFQVVSAQDQAKLAIEYCRATVEASRVFDRDSLFLVNGVVLAAGAIERLDGGVLNGVYMLASFVGEIPTTPTAIRPSSAVAGAACQMVRQPFGKHWIGSAYRPTIHSPLSRSTASRFATVWPSYAGS